MTTPPTLKPGSITGFQDTQVAITLVQGSLVAVFQVVAGDDVITGEATGAGTAAGLDRARACPAVCATELVHHQTCPTRTNCSLSCSQP